MFAKLKNEKQDRQPVVVVVIIVPASGLAFRTVMDDAFGWLGSTNHTNPESTRIVALGILARCRSVSPNLCLDVPNPE